MDVDGDVDSAKVAETLAALRAAGFDAALDVKVHMSNVIPDDPLWSMQSVSMERISAPQVIVQDGGGASISMSCLWVLLVTLARFVRAQKQMIQSRT